MTFRIALATAALLAGCATTAELSGDTAESALPDAPPVPEFLEKVRDGTLSNDRPEIGSLSVGCTGTLVAPEVVITAAHCVSYGSATSPGNYGSFTVQGAGGSSRYTVRRYVSFSRELGTADIALIQLAERVPAEVAEPRPLALVTPANGTALSIWGYGCTERNTRTDWRKRYVDFTEGQATNNLCPGDSGGPVIDESTGAVLRINSGYYHDNFGTDIFGHVPTYYDGVRAQVDAWSAGGVPEIGDADRPDTAPEDEPEPEQQAEPEDQPEPEAQPEQEPDPQPEAQQPDPAPQIRENVCGEGRSVYPTFVCTVDGTYKYRCVEGQEPEWVRCAVGCLSSRPNEDALCAEENVPAYRAGCGVWSPYTEWTCAQDRRTMVRCGADDNIYAFRCRNSCSWVDGPDICNR